MSRPEGSLAFRFAGVCVTCLVQTLIGAVFGYWLDQKFGTFFLVLVGLVVGMSLATFTLIRFSQKWTPVAKRSEREISDEAWQNDGDVK